MELFMDEFWIWYFSISAVYKASTNIHELHKVTLDVAVVGREDGKAIIVFKTHLYFVVISCNVMTTERNLRGP